MNCYSVLKGHSRSSCLFLWKIMPKQCLDVVLDFHFPHLVRACPQSLRLMNCILHDNVANFSRCSSYVPTLKLTYKNYPTLRTFTGVKSVSTIPRPANCCITEGYTANNIFTFHRLLFFCHMNFPY